MKLSFYFFLLCLLQVHSVCSAKTAKGVKGRRDEDDRRLARGGLRVGPNGREHLLNGHPVRQLQMMSKGVTSTRGTFFQTFLSGASSAAGGLVGGFLGALAGNLILAPDPTSVPTQAPTPVPTQAPTPVPTLATLAPTPARTEAPTLATEAPTAATPPVDPLNIDIAFTPVIGTADQEFFRATAQRWSEIIPEGLPTVTGISGTGKCGPYPTVVDDLYICATYEKLDPGIVGLAGPILFRQDSGLPYIGQMTFDIDFVAGNDDFSATLVRSPPGQYPDCSTFYKL